MTALEAGQRAGGDIRGQLRDLAGVWDEVPEASWALIRGRDQESRPFQPVVPG